MASVIAVLGQAIARRIGVGKHLLVADICAEKAEQGQGHGERWL